MKSYKSTAIACYVANFCQAIVSNFTAILFVPLKEQFGLTYAQFGFLVMLNFCTQVCVDLLFSKAVDKHGFRPFILTAQVLCGAGLVLFAFAPVLFAGNVYLGFLVATVVFSGASGLFELLLSPIVDAIPTKEKESAMAILHSFYAWGQVTVVLVTTLCVFLNVDWRLIVLGWSVVPFANTLLFARVPLEQRVSSEHAMKIRGLLRSPIFLLAFACILFGGASEVTMAQWASSFLQKGIALPKITGDILGMCGFAVMMGVGRVIYGIKGDKLPLEKVLVVGSATAAVCYLVAALSPFGWLSIVACCVCGICVSLMWPGSLVLAAKHLPLAGASMFALLAAGGDIGASIGPSLAGVLADAGAALPFSLAGLTPEQLGLRFSLLCAVIFPLCALFFVSKLRKASIEAAAETGAQKMQNA